MEATQRLRPEEKPKKVSDLEWKKSQCDKSPTGSHWFVPGSDGELVCRYCRKSHKDVWGTRGGSKKGVADLWLRDTLKLV